jgi:hypothetical protein
MTTKHASILTLAMLALAGCTTASLEGPPNPSIATAVTAGTTRKTDQYTKITTITGPEMKFDPSYRGYWMLRFVTAKASDGEVLGTYQLYVSYWAQDWAFLDRAHDRDGTSLELISIDRDVRNGISEIVGITVTRAYLEAHRGTGIDIRIDGKRENWNVLVPGYYIDGFLQALES